MARRRQVGEINVFGNAAFMDAMANTVGALIFLLLMVVVVTVALKLNYFDLVIKTPVKLPDGIVGKPYDVVLAGFGGNQPYKWKLVGGPLPANGLDLVPESQTARDVRQQRDYIGNVPHIIGTPLSATREPMLFDVELSDTHVVDDKTGKVIIETKTTRKRFELTIQPASYTPPALVIKTTTLPVAVVGKQYAVFASSLGGEPPYRWTADGTPMKAMLKMEAQEGRIVGIPTEAGEWPVRLAVQDRSGHVVQSGPLLFRALNYRDATEVEKEIAKLKKPLHVMTRSLPDAIVGRSYEVTLAAEGGVPPYKWSSCGTGSAKLRGLTITTDGRLSGTAASSVTIKACVQAESGDSAESPDLKLTAVVLPPPPAPLRLFTPGRGGAQ